MRFVVIPENQFGLLAGIYSSDDIAAALRDNKQRPEVIVYLADIIETGEGSMLDKYGKQVCNDIPV